MKKLPNPKTLKLRAWKALSRLVRDEEPYCVTCGRPTTEAGHYEPNGERNQSLGGNMLWYDRRNIHGQCAYCNRFGSRQVMMTAYSIFLEKTYGDGILQELKKLRNTPKVWTREELLVKENEFRSSTTDIIIN